MASDHAAMDATPLTRPRRRAARETVGAYDEEQLDERWLAGAQSTA